MITSPVRLASVLTLRVVAVTVATLLRLSLAQSPASSPKRRNSDLTYPKPSPNLIFVQSSPFSATSHVYANPRYPMASDDVVAFCLILTASSAVTRALPSNSGYFAVLFTSDFLTFTALASASFFS